MIDINRIIVFNLFVRLQSSMCSMSTVFVDFSNKNLFLYRGVNRTGTYVVDFSIKLQAFRLITTYRILCFMKIVSLVYDL